MSRWRTLVPAFLVALVSWSVALAYVARNDWFSAGDLGAFGFWCLMSAALAYPALRLLQRHVGSARTALLLLIAAVAGIAFGLAWTLLVVSLLGGAIGAFGFPVFLCWLTGSIVGFLASAVLIRPRATAAAACAALILSGSASALLAWMSTPPPDAIIYFKVGTTREQINHVENEILSTPTPRGFRLPAGVRGMTAAGNGIREGFRLSFWPGVSQGTRAAVLDRLRSVSLVEEIADAKPLTRADIERKFPEFERSK
jgi:hypothetical protein